MIVNLTPHPIRVYPIETPEKIEPAEHAAILELPPSTELPPARLGQNPLGTQYYGIGVPVELVEYGRLLLQPPPRVEGTWYVVPLVVALGCRREDFLVPYMEVRNMEGTQIGCRMFASPV